MYEKEIYLYVKKHNKTGLKYFGKTIQDPLKYTGSGKIWKKHIKENGNDVTTIILASFLDKEKCKDFAKKFSEENNIVESDEWANLIPETLGGGWKHDFCSIVERMKVDHIFNEDMRKKYSDSAKGHKRQSGNKNSAWGKMWITDGVVNKRVEKDSIIPNGWSKGSTIKYTKPKSNPSWFKTKQ